MARPNRSDVPRMDLGLSVRIRALPSEGTQRGLPKITTSVVSRHDANLERGPP